MLNDETKPSESSRSRWALPVVVAFLLLLPCLILANVIPFAWRFQVLVAVAVALAVLAAFQRLPSRWLGLRMDNLLPALKLQLPLVALLLVALSLAPHLGLSGRKGQPDWPFYIFYVVISSPCQEFIYRSYLYASCKSIDLTPALRTAVMTLPYALVHIIYLDMVTLLLTVFIGLVWAVTYSRQPNLIAVSLSHAILGATTIALGVI